MREKPVNSLTDRVLELALMFFGFVGMLAPLALWIAWSEFTFYLVLATGAVAIGAFVLLSWYFNARKESFAPV